MFLTSQMQILTDYSKYSLFQLPLQGFQVMTDSAVSVKGIEVNDKWLD